ncbi:MAG: acyl-CoA dehydrogenase family protein [Anaerolineae bacterium]|jgi:alkylation response protein AidB-like acyl-CoA dehydrogenase
MEFALNEEQQMFRAMFRDFSENEIAPVAEELDHEETFPLTVLEKAARQGFLGATLPEEHMGAALDFLSYSLLIEALARDCMSIAVIMGTHVSLVEMSILNHGSDSQKETFLPLLASGEALGAFAMTEPDAGSDTATLQTRALPEGDEYVIDGVKTWVANAETASARMGTIFLVFAEAPGGVTAFLIPADADGLTVGYREPTLGLRNVPFNTIYLEECRVSFANRVGAEGQGRGIADQAEQRMAITLGAAGLGLVRDSVDVAAQFASERVQFGVPVAEKQAIQNYLAESATDMEALQYLVYHGAWQVDQGSDLSFDASVVKAFAARVARSVTDRMVQVMGGYGYMEDYPVARKYRDARALGLIGGPTELHNVRIAQQVFAGCDVDVTP